MLLKLSLSRYLCLNHRENLKALLLLVAKWYREKEIHTVELLQKTRMSEVKKLISGRKPTLLLLLLIIVLLVETILLLLHGLNQKVPVVLV